MLRAAPPLPWVLPPGPNAPATITESPFLMSDTLAPEDLLIIVSASSLIVAGPFGPSTVIESALTAVTV